MTTIYGIYSADASQTPASGLEVMRVGPLAALIGNGRINLPSDPAQLTQILLEHQTAIHSVNASSILPCKLGANLPNRERVIERKLLTQKSDELKAKLDAVDGRVELGVRATWTDPAEVIERVLGEHPEISSLRDKIAASADHHARIRLGQMMENAILKRRDYVGAALEKRLVGLVEGISNGTLPEGVVANFSILMQQSELEKVENALHEFDNEHDLLTIRLTGPLPPFTFSEMTVRWEDDEE